MRRLVTILAMLSILMVAPSVALAQSMIEYNILVQVMSLLMQQQVALLEEVQQQNESMLEQIQLMSSSQCDEPIQPEDFDSRVLHKNATIKSVYVDLTNTSKMKLHLKLHRRDPLGTERDVYVHKCMLEAVGAALSDARPFIVTHAVVGLDSAGDSVLIRLSTGRYPTIPELE